jgi:cell division transport system permease protein
MFFLRSKRIIKTSFINFFRNGWLSLTATLIMMLALIIVGMFLAMNVSTNRLVKELENKIDIVVNFTEDASEAQIQQVKAELLAQSGIKSVRYISKEDALAEFKSRSNVKSEIRDLVSSEDNPLPRGLQIQSVETEELEIVATITESPTYKKIIDSSTYDDNKYLIERINSMGEFVKKFGLVLAGFFILIASLVVANTIRLAVMFREQEIEIMRLVGASESFVKIPFLIEGFLYGFFALAVALFLSYFGLGLVTAVIKNSEFYDLWQKFVPIYYEEFWYIALAQLLVGSFVGIGASWLSVRKNVKI